MNDFTTHEFHDRADAGPRRRFGHHDRHHGGFREPGPHGRGRGRGRHGRYGGRAQRGDVRAAALLLLNEGPMHGYQLIQEIAARTGGAWRPSPGAIYPALGGLAEEGLVDITRESSRQLVTLTEHGREFLGEHADDLGDPFAGWETDSEIGSLIDDVQALHSAAKQVVRGGDETQVAAARRTVAQAKRELYLILAGADAPLTEPETDES
jgi:DNA-binding PadR family transcriptional regulator